MDKSRTVPKRIRKKPTGILKLDSVRRRESSGSSLLQLGTDELSPPSSSVSPQLSVTWAFPPVGHSPDEEPSESPPVCNLTVQHQPKPITVPPTRDATGNRPPGSALTSQPPAKAPSSGRFGNGMKSPDAKAGAAFFAGDPTTPGARCDSDDDDEDYSASINAIIQRKASVKKKRGGYKGAHHRRTSSPGGQMMGLGTEPCEGRRRSSVYTTSSGETGITLPGDDLSMGRDESAGRQDKLFDTIRLHKEVLQTVKLQPISMKRKLRLVQQAKSYITRHEGALQEHFTSRTARSLLAQFNIFLTTKWQQLLRELANLATYLIPWESRIKEIESHFGSVVASYFTFLRWLFWVNIVISVLLVVFIMVPEEIYVDREKAKCDIRKTMSKQELMLTRNFSTIWEFEGYLKYSPLFYGYYSTFSGAIAWGYNLPLAYFFTGLVVYIYSFVATLKKMAENSRMSKLSSKDDEYVFSWKLFTGWDYMIGHMETAQNRMASIILGFKEALLEEAEKKKDTRNWKIILLRILVNFLILGLLVISAYEVILVVKRSMDIKESDSWWRRNEITVVMSLISFFFPMIFEALGIIEYYHPRKQLRIQLARIMVLNMLNLYSLIFALFDKIAHMTGELRRMKPTNFTSSAGQCFLPEAGTKWDVSGGGGVESLSSDRSFLLEMLANFTRAGAGSETLLANGSSCFRMPINCTNATGSVTLLTTLLLTNLSTTIVPERDNPTTGLSSNDYAMSTWTSPTTIREYRSPYDGYEYNEEDMDYYLEYRARLLPNDKLEGVPINKREAVFDSVVLNNTADDDNVSSSVLETTQSSTELPAVSTEFQTMTYTELHKYITGRYDDFLASYYYSSESDEDDDNEEEEYKANQFLTSEEARGNVPAGSTERQEPTAEGSTTSELSSTLVSEEVTTEESPTTAEEPSTWMSQAEEMSTTHQYDQRLTTPVYDDDPTTITDVIEENLSEMTTETPEVWTESTQTDSNVEAAEETSTTATSNVCYHWVCLPGSLQGADGQESKYRNADIRSLCWETMFGQELAKLTVMDLIVTIVSTLILDFLRALFVRYMNNCWCWDLEKKFPKYGDFKIAENILHLVNNQGMVWMGMFFSPGLAVLNIAKLVIILYLRSWTVLTCNVPHEVVFRASRSNNFYFALLLTMLFLCVLPVSYAIVFLEPSWHCGPFSNSNRIYHLLTNATERIIPEIITKYIVSPAAIIPLLVLLILIIYYLISLTGSLREANQDLKLQLRKERTEERRKMFKIASSTQQQTPGTGISGINGLSSSWHKVLDSTQLRLQSTTDNATDSENSSSKRKELLQRMMKKALQKEHASSADVEPVAGAQKLSTEPSFPVSPPVIGTINEKQRPAVHTKPAKLNEHTEADVFRFDRESVEQMHRHDADRETASKEAGNEGDEGRKKFERVRPSTAERFRMAAKAERRRMQGKMTEKMADKTADWIEKIPVITISKTSSDECIIESDLDDPNDRPSGSGAVQANVSGSNVLQTDGSL
ncbi:transmembrane channel-like protein [Anopheles nili]|uniref:transmembrane channel-like protein n=1 Tax=Anopheles nili TaxID=185578 RepID=UPI00237B7F6D|nr:transmembrane channel-like protein [Anopheles nili]